MKLIKADGIRNYLIEKAHEAIDNHTGLDPVDFTVDAVGFIDSLPEYQSSPKLAHWVEDSMKGGYYFCSNCNHLFRNELGAKNNPKFCFECGSRMAFTKLNTCICNADPNKKCDYADCINEHGVDCCLFCKDECAFPCSQSGRRPND